MNSGLEEKRIEAVCSHSQLDSQLALYLPQPLEQLQDASSRKGINHITIGRAFTNDCFCCSQMALTFRYPQVEMIAGLQGLSRKMNCCAQES